MAMKKVLAQNNLPYVGALWDLAGRVAFVFNCLNYLLMTRVYYFNTGDSLIRDTFQSYSMFLFIAFALFAVLSIILYKFVVPAHNQFTQEQSYLDGRSPLFDKVVELMEQNTSLQTQLTDIQKQLKDIENKL